MHNIIKQRNATELKWLHLFLLSNVYYTHFYLLIPILTGFSPSHDPSSVEEHHDQSLTTPWTIWRSKNLGTRFSRPPCTAIQKHKEIPKLLLFPPLKLWIFTWFSMARPPLCFLSYFQAGRGTLAPPAPPTLPLPPSSRHPAPCLWGRTRFLALKASISESVGGLLHFKAASPRHEKEPDSSCVCMLLYSHFYYQINTKI